MGYAVELLFDEKTENLVRQYWKAIDSLGISLSLEKLGARPHISIAVYNNIDINRLEEKVKKFFCDKPPIKLRFESVSIFPTDPCVVFLGLGLNEELLNIHKSYHLYMNELQSEELKYYLPDRWVPHCAVAMEVAREKVMGVIGEIMTDFNQFDFIIDKIGIIKFNPVKSLVTFDLN